MGLASEFLNGSFPRGHVNLSGASMELQLRDRKVIPLAPTNECDYAFSHTTDRYVPTLFLFPAHGNTRMIYTLVSSLS